MGPGGLHKNQSYVQCTGGATGYIDGIILGNHRYRHPTFAKVYETGPFDPEATVGTYFIYYIPQYGKGKNLWSR